MQILSVIVPIIVALVSGILSYFTVKMQCSKEIAKLKAQNEDEMRKMKQEHEQEMEKLKRKNEHEKELNQENIVSSLLGAVFNNPETLKILLQNGKEDKVKVRKGSGTAEKLW